MDVAQLVRDKAKELLQSKAVELVIGYETGSDGLNARPAFIYDVSEVERLIFDETCTHNLAKYLLNKKNSKAAVVVKGCDSRSLNLLIGEKQVERDQVHIIGVVCPGTVEWGWGVKSENRQNRCESCRNHTPVIYDTLVGEPVKEPYVEQYADLKELEGRPAEERAAFWRAHAESCLRCYACRQACPGCYCIDCFVEQLDPEWVGITIAPNENQMWNTIRAFHLAGRCTACNECERVCPVGIPLSLLNRKMEQKVLELFDYRAGMQNDTPAPLNAFKKDDKVGIGE